MRKFSAAIQTAFKKCLDELPAEYTKLEKVRHDTDLSDSGKLAKSEEIQEKIQSIKITAFNSINDAGESYAARLEKSISEMSGKDIDNADFKLLTENLVQLNNEEFGVICERYKGNYLMMKALKEYSDKHKHLNMPYEVYSKEAKYCKSESVCKFLCECIRTCVPIKDDRGGIQTMKSFEYETWVAMNGFENLDKICYE